MTDSVFKQVHLLIQPETHAEYISLLNHYENLLHTQIISATSNDLVQIQGALQLIHTLKNLKTYVKSVNGRNDS